MRQAGIYKDGLDHCFGLLGESPTMGRRAPLLGEDVRRYEHGSHVILYEGDREGILILAVVHRRSVRRLKL